jgi:hypothetical protein
MMNERLSLCLMLKILDLVKESGANLTEADCALAGAMAMLPDCDLPTKPTMVIQT